MGARARFGTYSEQQHARNDRIVRDTAPSESVDLHSTARHLRGTIRDLIHRLVLAAGRPRPESPRHRPAYAGSPLEPYRDRRRPNSLNQATAAWVYYCASYSAGGT